MKQTERKTNWTGLGMKIYGIIISAENIFHYHLETCKAADKITIKVFSVQLNLIPL